MLRHSSTLVACIALWAAPALAQVDSPAPAPAEAPAPAPAEVPAPASAEAPPVAATEPPVVSPADTATGEAPTAEPTGEIGVTAEAPAEESAGLRVVPAGLWRLSASGFSPLRVDADGHRYGQRALAGHRLGIGPEVHLGETARLVTDLQVLAGHFSNDAPGAELAGFGPPRDAEAFDEVGDQIHLRKLYLQWRMPVGMLMAGRMASQWGLGLLASSGDDEQRDWGEPRFGTDRGYGDIVDRVVFATAPAAIVTEAPWAKDLIVAVGADTVVRDERTLRSEGDRAYEAIGVVRYSHDKDVAGLYVALRDVEDRNGDTLRVAAYDVHGQIERPLGPVSVRGALEAVVVSGETTLGRNNAFPSGDLLVQQLGYVARAGAAYALSPGASLGGDLELGYASGDSNPNDRFIRNFSFDPDYNPSLILFEELRAAETVAAAANASDPERVGYPPDSARLLPSGGAVSNAIYLKPTARYERDGLAVRLAVLWARAEEAVVDPFNSTVQGGVATNFQGGDGSARDLGVEVDVGADYTLTMLAPVELAVGLQAGRLWPGKAFANADGVKPDPVNLVYGKVVGRWRAEQP